MSATSGDGRSRVCAVARIRQHGSDRDRKINIRVGAARKVRRLMHLHRLLKLTGVTRTLSIIRL